MSKPKKILLTAQYNKFGGARYYFIHLLKFYNSQGYKVTVCLTKEDQQIEITSIIEELGFNIITIRKRLRGFKQIFEQPVISFFSDISLIIRAYIKVNPDLVVVSNITPDAFLGLAFFRTPYICIVHSYPLDNLSRKYIIRMLQGLRRILLNWIFAKPKKKIVSVSNFSKREIIKLFGVPEQSVSIIYNFGKKPAEALPRTDSNEQNHLILTYGHVRYYKNPFDWISVAEKVIQYFPNTSIQFIWGGDGELLDSSKALVNSMGLEDKIKFIGFTRDVDLYYKSATIYFQPSLLESHGIAVVDAMAYSLPCVVSNVGGLPESVSNGENGYFVNVDDLNAMSEAIISIIIDEDLRKQMGRNSLNIFNEKFSYDIWTAKMKVIHERIFDYK